MQEEVVAEGDTIDKMEGDAAVVKGKDVDKVMLDNDLERVADGQETLPSAKQLLTAGSDPEAGLLHSTSERKIAL